MKKILCLIVSLAIFGISGCEVFLGPDVPVGIGTLSISFGKDGGSRSAFDVSEDILATLRYDLVLTGPDKQKISASFAVGQTFNGQVALGEWRIEAKAFAPDNTLFGTGSTVITVRAGPNLALVPMTRVPSKDTPVSAFDLTALVAAPVRDTTPNTTVIDEAQYTGTISWDPAHSTFAPSTAYQAEVVLTATAGYTFAGVDADSFTYTGADSVTNPAGSGNAMTVPISFPATLAMQHTITFDSHEGSAVTPITANTGTPVDKPTDPTRTDYSFLGWFDAESGGGLYPWPHTLTANVTMHAQWQDSSQPPPTQYIITFDSHSGSAVPSIPANVNTAVNKPTDPTRTGYSFQGWFSAATGGTEYAWPHTLTGDITMHAHWMAISYTVVYNANSGSGTMP
ncbi:MAG: InlB B-repeat-containing protein, partial [Treponema sp.]|nr:InlB B-repeat-containing protein [Treponema sp.]